MRQLLSRSTGSPASCTQRSRPLVHTPLSENTALPSSGTHLSLQGDYAVLGPDEHPHAVRAHYPDHRQHAGRQQKTPLQGERGNRERRRRQPEGWMETGKLGGGCWDSSSETQNRSTDGIHRDRSHPCPRVWVSDKCSDRVYQNSENNLEAVRPRRGEQTHGDQTRKTYKNGHHSA